MFDADTPCVAIGNKTIIIFILTVIIIIFIEIQLDIIYDGVLSNCETIFFPFKDTAKMGPMIALATRSTQNSWQRYQTCNLDDRDYDDSS